MGLTTVRIGARRAGKVQDVLDWLDANVGSFTRREVTGVTGIVYTGKNWSAHWKQYGAGWFMDVSFNDPKHATFFTLRWK